MKRTMVTGASGFVGANLTRRLLAEGHQVHLLLRPEYARWRLQALCNEVQIHEVDLHDAEGLARTISLIRPEWAFHLAAYGAYPQQTDLTRMIATNISATGHLIEACLAADCEAFVHAGSSSEYGLVDHAPAEGEAIDPNSHYAWTKAAATHLCRHIARDRDAHLTVLRLYSAYGPYETPTRLLPTLIRQGLRGELPPLVNPGIARDFVFVEDICEAFLLAAAHQQSERGAVYNVGSGVQTTLREIVELARRRLDIAAEPAWGSMGDRHWDTEVWVADAEKITRELGWRPRYTLAEGFDRTVKWFIDHADLLPRLDRT
ncbi:MAG TPA: NAD-dependent epimerase/dehydratase family protein [Candidatus Latescibacteria bacterium]|nr:NAD-dependent epimerase/dehydratase family protein [Candidatus Handelsmanbacteria bacterium]HIL10359.1 NAD-dependent epimerase/dehydratase family protein [Candidatus Latescibacterota bacterium]